MAMILPGPHALLTLTPLSATPAGARLVESETSRLVVGAAPIDELGLLLAHPAFARRPGAYGLIGDAMRWGESLDLTARLGSHLADPPLAAEGVVLITSLHAGFGRDAVTALQHVLHHQSLAAGRIRVIGAPPQRSWLQVSRPALVARWLDEIRPMLVAAGCSLLEPPGSRLEPRERIEPGPQPLVNGEDGADELPLQRGFITEIPHHVYEDEGAARYVLNFRGLQAEAIAVEGLCVLLAGSTLAAEASSGVQRCIDRKRARLVEEGLARKTPAADVVRLHRDVGVPSLTNGGRVVSGTNLPAGELWTRVA